MSEVLHEHESLTLEPIRKGFGKGLLEAGKKDERVVGVCADLTESTNMHFFAEAFPERFIDVGVAEQNLVTVGSGLAAMGKIPFVSSYAAFNPGRNWEQIRTTICLNDQPVKIIGSHAGLYTGADGATHQMLEDLILMRALPNMVVLAPCDSIEASKATLAMAADKRPNYMRVTREATPIITTDDTPFQIGRAYVFKKGKDVSLIATGTMTYQAMAAAATLVKDGINAEVVHVPTIKPIDHQVIIESAERTKHVVTIEEGQINGGLGGAVAELLGENLPTPMIRVGMNDHFGESGKPEELLKHFGLTHTHIAMTAHRLLMDHPNHKH
ncbi:MAG TPA: transketolase C-terminal domain-containing protein [Candidatus Saccharimonadales bacterium]|nr:transketolase C-terminal domain-containing protein [Candidatus Saccharimonadales bacterium]